MRGVRFYVEDTGNVVAALVANGWRHGMCDAIAAAYDSPNSAPCSTTVSREYLASCKRVSEVKARELHPAIFTMLDAS